MIPRLAWLDWRQTPWGKATRGQWIYALRNAIAMCFALAVAFRLDLGNPYWAMTSAAVVSFPTVGGVISKSLGRVIGSLVGAIASLVIVGLTLNEPWLFVLFISLWIGFCTYISNHYQNNVSYGFALAGYTAAIIAFSVVNYTDPEMIFDVAQSRLCEVILGILSGGMMMMILPSTSDGTSLFIALRQMQTQLRDHFTLLLDPRQFYPETRSEDHKIKYSHQGVIRKILSMNLLRIQAFWSHHHLRYQNNALNYLLSQQLTLTSHMSSLRRMLFNHQAHLSEWHPVIEQLAIQLANPNCNQYQLAQILAQIKPQADSDFKHIAIWNRLREFCWIYLRCERLLQGIESSTISTPSQFAIIPKTSRGIYHTDKIEAAYNGFRTFICLVIGCAFWIQTQWDDGSGALILAAISCVLYSQVASPLNSISLQVRALLWLTLGCFVIKFGLMIQMDTLSAFLPFLFTGILTMQLLKQQNPQSAAMWGQLIVYSGSFLSILNPPSYDYADFLNGTLAQIVGVMLAGLAFHLFKPSSERRKGLRLIRATRRDFLDQLTPHPSLTPQQFESLVYQRINLMSQSQDQYTRFVLLRLGVGILNSSHIIWQLDSWETKQAHPLNQLRSQSIVEVKGILTEVTRSLSLKKVYINVNLEHPNFLFNEAVMEKALSDLNLVYEKLAQTHQAQDIRLAGIIWRLYCSLLQLKQPIELGGMKVA